LGALTLGQAESGTETLAPQSRQTKMLTGRSPWASFIRIWQTGQSREARSASAV